MDWSELSLKFMCVFMVAFVTVLVLMLVSVVFYEDAAYQSAIRYCDGDRESVSVQYNIAYCKGVALACNDSNCWAIYNPVKMRRVCTPILIGKITQVICRYEKVVE